MNWYNDFGFEQNPLEPNPFFSDSFLVKYKHETRWIERSLKAENIVLLEGSESSGKTIIAKELTERMNCLYLDAGRISKNNNIEKLIRKRFSRPMLIVDNAQHLTFDNLERIKYFYDKKNVRGVLFTAEFAEDVPFSESLKHRIGRRIVKLRNATAKDAIIITKKRLGKSNPFSDRIILRIFGFSNNDLKLHLNNCEKVLKHLIDNELESISENELNLILSGHVYRQSFSADNCHKCEKELALINDYWRCPVCDTFCLHCGCLVLEEDEECPDCGENL